MSYLFSESALIITCLIFCGVNAKRSLPVQCKPIVELYNTYSKLSQYLKTVEFTCFSEVKSYKYIDTGGNEKLFNK